MTAITPASTPADSQARKSALSALDSYAVTAPAGSGKTGLLTQRVLKLLPFCEHPEEIICITFTRKAAAEMRERIIHAINTAVNQNEPENAHEKLTWQLARKVLEHDALKNWNLLLTPNRLRILTIDSFARTLARQLPLESGLGIVTDQLDQPEQAYRLAVRETLSFLEKNSALQADIERLLRHLDNNLNAIQDLLIALLSKRDQWLGPLLSTRDARHYLESVIMNVVTEALEKAHTQLQPWSSNLALLADYAANNLKEASDNESVLSKCLGITSLPPATPDALPLWLGIIELLLTKSNEWRSRVDKRQGFPTGKNKEEKERARHQKSQLQTLIGELKAVPDLLPALTQLRFLPPVNYDNQQWSILDSLTRILPVLVAQLKLVFGQLAATDYIEITQAALTALGDSESPTDLALRLDYQIRHILVDEFQDTATPQLNLLEKLTAGWQNDDGRTLFIVGDGMQSCYAFRNANVGIFLDARQHGIGTVDLKPLDLTVNFRSYKGIVRWVNQVFEGAFPAQDDINRGAVSYSESEAHKPEWDTQAVTCFGCIDQDSRQLEAQTVVSLVRQTQTERPEDSIAILVRNRSHLGTILSALKQADIEWQATDIDPLSSRMAIQDIISLTKALLDPTDRIAWLSLLRAPWCGLDMHDLYYLVTVNPNITETTAAFYPLIWTQIRQFENISQLSKDGSQILARVRDILDHALSQRRRKSLRFWIEGAWLALGGPASLTDASDIDNISRYFNLLDSHERGGIIPDWHIFEQAINQLYAQSQVSSASLHVMTIHKSKGLEFDTVIIPGLDRAPRQEDHQLILWHEQITQSGDKQLLLGPLAATGNDPDPLYQFLRREQTMRTRLEANRLLYVGCTRAIKKLYLIANLSTQAKEQKEDKPLIYKTPSASSLLHAIWESVADSVQPLHTSAADVDQNTQQSQQQTRNHHIVRLLPDWKTPAIDECHLLKAFRGHEFAGDENIPTTVEFNNRISRHIGTIIHRTLRQISVDGLTQWTESRLSDQRFYWQQQLKQQGISGHELVAGMNKILQAVSNTLNDEKGKWILDHSHPSGKSEFSIWKTGDSLSHQQSHESVIDRIFVYENDQWIIDYKTSEPATDHTVDEFCALEIAQYRPQLQHYANLAQELYTHPVRAGLYFPMLPRFCEVDLT